MPVLERCSRCGKIGVGAICFDCQSAISKQDQLVRDLSKPPKSSPVLGTADELARHFAPLPESKGERAVREAEEALERKLVGEIKKFTPDDKRRIANQALVKHVVTKAIPLVASAVGNGLGVALVSGFVTFWITFALVDPEKKQAQFGVIWLVLTAIPFLYLVIKEITENKERISKKEFQRKLAIKRLGFSSEWEAIESHIPHELRREGWSREDYESARNEEF